MGEKPVVVTCGRTKCTPSSPSEPRSNPAARGSSLLACLDLDFAEELQ
ncbi:hypothetical protein ACWD48_37635 [Streptomyces sp. NPDC002519]